MKIASAKNQTDSQKASKPKKIIMDVQGKKKVVTVKKMSLS
jgi:hypothetical protein